MAFQFSTASRNAALDTIESTVGASAILKLRSGSVPETVATADSGTVLSTLPLPSDWLSAASGGSKVLLGSWTVASADATGTAGHFRIYANDGTTAHIQGSVTTTGGGGDMTLDNTSVTAGQAVTISAFSITAAGA
jgi:hypothetical protein